MKTATLAIITLKQVKELISKVKPESVRMRRACSHYFTPERARERKGQGIYTNDELTCDKINQSNLEISEANLMVQG